MQCNIKRQGRTIRVVIGAVAAVAGIALVVQTTGPLAFVGLALIALGGFMIFEGSVGWCAVRAMGVRTPF